MYLVGGYMPQIKSYLKNTFTLDEHRSILVALQNMTTARSDHALIYFKGNIYVFGGEGLVQGSKGEALEAMSLTSCETYSIENDAWTEIPPFSHAR